jgi:hypothetical protein
MLPKKNNPLRNLTFGGKDFGDKQQSSLLVGQDSGACSAKNTRENTCFVKYG